MIIPRQALAFGLMGLFLALWTAFCLWRGKIWTRGSVISRDTEHFQFYVWIFGYALIATLFLGAGILFWLHPGFNLHPKIEQGLDE